MKTMKTLIRVWLICLLVGQFALVSANTPVVSATATAYDVPSATDSTARLAISTVGSTQIALNGEAFTDSTPATIVYQINGSGCSGCTSPSHGTLSNLSIYTGIVVYTPTAGFTGDDSFTYKVAHGSGTPVSSVATVRLTVTNSRTTVTGTLVDGSGTALTGTVTFYLSQTAVNPTSTGAIVSPAGLISPTASVSATLTAGVFSVSLYPSVSLSPQAYYVMEHRTTSNLKSGLVRVFSVPASTSTVNIATCGCEVTDANLRARFVWASEAMAKNALSLSRTTTVAVDGVEVGAFDTINFVTAANIAITPTDNLDGSVDIEIADPTGGSGGTVSSGAVGRLAKYSGTTSVNALTIGTANQVLGVNAAANGYEHKTVTAGTGITVTQGVGTITIANSGAATINSLTPSSGNINIAASLGTCGSDPGVTASGSTVTVCIPLASATANGTVTASSTSQTIAGPKIFTGFGASDVPVTIQEYSGLGPGALLQFKTADGTTVGTFNGTDGGLANGLWAQKGAFGTALSAPATTSGTGVLYVSESLGATGLIGIRSHIISTAGSTGLQGGIWSRRFLDGTGNYTNTSNSSLRGELTWSGSGTLSKGTVIRGELISDDTGTCTQCDIVASYATVNTSAIGSLTHFRATAYTGNAAITNLYGLYIEGMTGALTTNDAIYTNAGLVSFGDIVDIRGQSSASVSNSSEMRLWYDLSNNLPKISWNGGAFGQVSSFLSGSASLDYAQASANTCETKTLTVTGAVDGKPVSIGATHTLSNHNTTATFYAWVSATNTVSVRRCVISADGSDPAAATVVARVGQ